MKENPDNLQKFIENALQVPVCILNENNLGAFENINCFIKEVQVNYTEEYILFCMDAMKEDIFYEIKDLLNTHSILFTLAGKKYMIGPFVETAWDDAYAEELLAKLKLPSTYLAPFKMYYCGFQKESAQTIIRVVSAAINSFTERDKTFKHRILIGQYGNEDLDFSAIVEQNFSLIEKRYELENQFIESFKTGNVNEIVEAHKKMRRLGTVISNWMSAKYSGEGATAVRTLCRKAAEEAGVNILKIDAISLEYAQKCNVNRDPVKMAMVMEDMVICFAKAVADAKATHYSHPLRKVIDYIHIHLSNELNMKELSEMAGISPGHLSKIFKIETNLTTSEYIAKVRCEKASELLMKSDLPVQDIAAFVGYIDNNYFVKVFKKWMGKSPTEFRKTNL